MNRVSLLPAAGRGKLAHGGGPFNESAPSDACVADRQEP